MKLLFTLFSSKSKGLFIIFSFYLISHILFLTLPPKGSHIWRQCHTSTVARNFVEEGMNIFQPRIDNRGNGNGITGMQFPSFEYTVALLSKVIGYSDGLNRIVAFLYFGLGIWYFYALLAFLFKNNTVSFCGTWAFTFSPILYYHSITALPDILALSASIAGLYYFLVWNENRNLLVFILSLFFTTLAGLTKLQYLAIGFPIAVLIFSSFCNKKYAVKDLILLAIFGIVSVGLSLAWYDYALYLIETSGLRDFGISFKPAENLTIALYILWVNLYSDFTEKLINIPNLIPFGFALYWIIKYKTISVQKFWMYSIWAAALFAYHIIELQQMDVHTYYMFPYLPLIFIIAAKGYALLLEKQKYLLVLLILISLPIIAIAGTFHNFINDSKNLPKDFFITEERNALDKIIPDNAFTLLGPDQSHCIYLYFTHTKGLTFGNAKEFNKQWLKNGIEKGATYLIWEKKYPLPQFTNPYILEKVNYKGTDLDVYLLKP